MAILSTITCDTCHKDKKVNHSSSEPRPKTCDECKEAATGAERQRHLDHLATLPFEERLRLIEEFVYDHERSYHPEQPFLC